MDRRASDGEVVLLAFWASPFRMRVRIALVEKGVEHEYREEDFAEQEHPCSCRSVRLGDELFLTKGGEQEAAKKEFIDCLKVLEWELRDKPFFGGETLGLVDIAVVPFYSWFYGYEKCGSFNIETHCPKLIAWAESGSQKDSVSKSLANREKGHELANREKVHGFMSELKKRFGVY